jgi:hypothetical protein
VTVLVKTGINYGQTPHFKKTLYHVPAFTLVQLVSLMRDTIDGQSPLFTQHIEFK